MGDRRGCFDPVQSVPGLSLGISCHNPLKRLALNFLLDLGTLGALFLAGTRGYRIVAIMSASQALKGGSIPPTRSIELSSISQINKTGS